MILTFQNRIILNTFSRQPIKTIQGNIMWLSNFHLHMFTNVLKFWCYDPNLSSSGQTRFCRSLSDSQLVNVYRVFFCLKLETNLAVSCLEAQNAFLCNPSFLFFFTGWNKRYFSVFFLFLPRELKKEDNYMWQWIREIIISTQLYKLCTKRETKVGLVLSRKIT